MRGLDRAGSGEHSIVAAAADVHLKYKYHDLVSNVPPRAEHSSRSSCKAKPVGKIGGGAVGRRCSEVKKRGKTESSVLSVGFEPAIYCTRGRGPITPPI